MGQAGNVQLEPHLVNAYSKIKQRLRKMRGNHGQSSIVVRSSLFRKLAFCAIGMNVASCEIRTQQMV